MVSFKTIMDFMALLYLMFSCIQEQMVLHLQGSLRPKYVMSHIFGSCLLVACSRSGSPFYVVSGYGLAGFKRGISLLSSLSAHDITWAAFLSWLTWQVFRRNHPGQGLAASPRTFFFFSSSSMAKKPNRVPPPPFFIIKVAFYNYPKGNMIQIEAFLLSN